MVRFFQQAGIPFPDPESVETQKTGQPQPQSGDADRFRGRLIEKEREILYSQ
jgi:hypothetical protein